MNARATNRGRSALVTGATSGLGLEAAAQLVETGYKPVILTGRTKARADEAKTAVNTRTGHDHATAVSVDLEDPASIDAAVAQLAAIGQRIDALILNAGLISGGEQRRTPDGIEQTFAASLTGHHRLTMGLLERGLLADDARIVIAGSEAARGDVPMMKITDLPSLANSQHGGDLSAAARALISGDEPAKFRPNNTYADAKVFVAWWAAALARRLPAGMAVNAVSPGATPGTEAGRRKGFVMRKLMMPLMAAMPERLNMGGSLEAGARRYLDGVEFDQGVTGQFFASAPKRMSGPLHRVDLAYLGDFDYQEAAWHALVSITGASLPANDEQSARADELPGRR